MRSVNGRRAWFEGIRDVLAGRPNAAHAQPPGEVASLDADLLFRYATCDDLVLLKARHPDGCFFGDPLSNASEAWGLKQMGTLYCLDKLRRLKPARVLEVGAGCDLLFRPTRWCHQRVLDDR